MPCFAFEEAAVWIILLNYVFIHKIFLYGNYMFATPDPLARLFSFETGDKGLVFDRSSAHLLYIPKHSVHSQRVCPVSGTGPAGLHESDANYDAYCRGPRITALKK